MRKVPIMLLAVMLAGCSSPEPKEHIEAPAPTAPSTATAAEDTGLTACRELSLLTGIDARGTMAVDLSSTDQLLRWSEMFAASGHVGLREAGQVWVAEQDTRGAKSAKGFQVLLDRECDKLGQPFLPEIFRAA